MSNEYDIYVLIAAIITIPIGLYIRNKAIKELKGE